MSSLDNSGMEGPLTYIMIPHNIYEPIILSNLSIECWENLL